MGWRRGTREWRPSREVFLWSVGSGSGCGALVGAILGTALGGFDGALLGMCYGAVFGVLAGVATGLLAAVLVRQDASPLRVGVASGALTLVVCELASLPLGDGWWISMLVPAVPGALIAAFVIPLVSSRPAGRPS